MKKLLWISLLMLAFVSLTACGENNNSSSSRSPSNSVEMEAGGEYGSAWDNDFELPEDYFN
jgi:hypothetical protein